MYTRMNCHWKHILGFVILTIVGICVLAIFLISSSSETNQGQSLSSTKQVPHKNSVKDATSESERSAMDYVHKINTKLTQKCAQHSSDLFNYKITPSNETLSAYLRSKTDHEYFLLNEPKFGVAGSAEFKNETLLSMLSQLKQKLASTSVRSQQQFYQSEQIKEVYKAQIAAFAEPHQLQISEYEYDEQEEGGPMPSNYRNRTELNQQIWTNFHNKFGNFVQRNLYPKYLQILKDQDHSKIPAFEPETYLDDSTLDSILEKIHPLYTLLHGYVRGISRDYQMNAFNRTLINPTASIPIHLISPFGNWQHYNDGEVPFDQIHMGPITYNILVQNLDSYELLEMANKLFESLNLTDTRLPNRFWKESTFFNVGLSSGDYETVCEGTFDVCEMEEYKTIFCDGMNYENFRDFHRKLGDVWYMMMAKPGLSLPNRGINPALVQANGVFWYHLSGSPKYLHRLGLWEHVDWPLSISQPNSVKATLNFQYSEALRIIPSLLEFITLTKWQNAMVQGKINTSNSNCHYWKLREEFEGVQPPSTRKSTQFDAFQAILLGQRREFFLGQILGFQLHRHACTVAGEYDSKRPPLISSLQQCDITGNLAASKVIRKFMSFDSTSSILETLLGTIGSSEISVNALLDYFQPLYNFLSSYNFESKFAIGWDNELNSYQSCI